jgi:hypothetical protein
LVLLVAAIANLTGCERTAIKYPHVPPCASEYVSNFKFDGKVVNVKGKVVRLPTLSPDAFVIEFEKPLPANAMRRLPLGACNLPDEYKIEGLNVLFSANLLWFIHSEDIAIDVSTQPIELTAIKRIDN